MSALADLHESRYSYGDPTGSCSSGFDLEVVQRLTDIPSRSHSDYSGTFHFEVADQSFFSRKFISNEDNFFFIARPFVVQNKRGRIVSDRPGDLSAQDYGRRDSDFHIAIEGTKQSKELADLLNKLHWACMLQSDTARVIPANPSPAQSKTAEE